MTARDGASALLTECTLTFGTLTSAAIVAIAIASPALAGCDEPFAQQRLAEVAGCPMTDEKGAVDRLESRIIELDRLRKERAAANSAYRERGAISLCPPPHRMSDNGCR